MAHIPLRNTAAALVKPKKGKHGAHLKGRPKGVLNKRTLSVRSRNAAAMASGYLPHEFLLSICRGETKWTNGIRPTMEERMDAAAKAAPYFAPRLSAVEVMRGLTDQELDAMIQAAGPAAGVQLLPLQTAAGPVFSPAMPSQQQPIADAQEVGK